MRNLSSDKVSRLGLARANGAGENKATKLGSRLHFSLEDANKEVDKTQNGLFARHQRNLENSRPRTEHAVTCFVAINQPPRRKAGLLFGADRNY